MPLVFKRQFYESFVKGCDDLAITFPRAKLTVIMS